MIYMVIQVNEVVLAIFLDIAKSYNILYTGKVF